MTTYSEAVEQTITAGEQIHQIVNGTATTEVTVEDGSKVPSIRKALLDNFYFKDPIAWQVGQTENVFNQLRQFTDGSWWYAPSATAINPISMGSTPVGDSLWKIYDFDAIGKLTPQLREALRRSYAEAGYNLVDGSFEAGGTLVNADDVLLQERTGKAFSGAAGTVAAGTNPESGGFVDSSVLGVGAGVVREGRFALRDFLSVKDFGAKGDGLSDDTAAIQAAIYYAGNSSGTVFIPRGNYKVNGELIVWNNTTIRGDGMRETVLNVALNTGKVFNMDGSHRVSISDLTVNSGTLAGVRYGTASTTVAFSARASTTNRFVDVRVYGCHIAYDFGTNSWVQSLERCEVYACNTGIVGNGEFNMVYVHGCTLHSCDLAMDIGGGRGVFINDSWIELNNKGIRKVNLGSIYITDNYIERNASYCISVEWGTSPADHCVIRNNDFFTTSDDYSFIRFHGDASTLIDVSNNNFSYYSSAVPTPLNCYALRPTNTTTPSKVSWEYNALDQKVKKYNRNLSAGVWLKNSETRSLYDGDVFYDGGSASTIDLTALVNSGVTSVRMYTTGNATVAIPSRVGVDIDVKPLKFVITGTDTVTLDLATNSCVIINNRPLQSNKIYTLIPTRIISGNTTEYLLAE